MNIKFFIFKKNLALFIILSNKKRNMLNKNTKQKCGNILFIFIK